MRFGECILKSEYNLHCYGKSCTIFVWLDPKYGFPSFSEGKNDVPATVWHWIPSQQKIMHRDLKLENIMVRKDSK